MQEYCDAGNLGDCIIQGDRQDGQLPTGHAMVSICSELQCLGCCAVAPVELTGWPCMCGYTHLASIHKRHQRVPAFNLS